MAMNEDNVVDPFETYMINKYPNSNMGLLDFDDLKEYTRLLMLEMRNMDIDVETDVIIPVTAPEGLQSTGTGEGEGTVTG